MKRTVVLATMLTGIVSWTGAGWARQQPPGGAAQAAPLRVFLDCGPCDFDHFRREVTFVDYMRDRMDAQVHVLVTTQGTGGGGREFAFNFIGLRDLNGLADTLFYVSRQADTEDEIRTGLTETFKAGLVRYIARAGGMAAISITSRRAEEEEEELSGQVQDPWNLWVFRANMSSEFQGERRESSFSMDGSLSASRTTESLKINLRGSGDYNQDRFELSSGRKVVSVSRDYSFNGTVVWSLGPHWSAGLRASSSSATRVNQDLALRAAPAVEFNFYPYVESTRRQITVLYTIGGARFDYQEITLFDRIAETRLDHSLEIGAEFVQPWGDINASLEATSFLDDFSQHRIDLFSNFEIRVFRGLNLDLQGSVARIKDQIYVPREDIPDEEVLLRRRELGTDYDYSFDVGFSFFFGSVFNNVVNPRMNQGRRDFR